VNSERSEEDVNVGESQSEMVFFSRNRAPHDSSNFPPPSDNFALRTSKLFCVSIRQVLFMIYSITFYD
jgi:hypothetical protein